MARPTHPFLDHDAPVAFAHRGGAGEAPENTMAAFARAVDLGYRHLELDVRATADGHIVVFHDPSLERVAGRRGRIGRLRFDELDGVRVAGTQPIPRLVDVLDAWPGVAINIDPKDDAVVAPLAKLLSHRRNLERVCVMSFSDRRLSRLRRLVGPGLCTALGPAAMTRLRLAASGVRVGRITGQVAQVPPDLGGVRLLDSAVVATAARLGLPIHVWVVDEAPEMEALLDLGVDGIMTDHPTVLRDVLALRGQWRG